MAISQSKYVHITSDVNTTALGSRDFSGLVFTTTAMLASAPSATKTAYDANEVVGLDYNSVAKCFGDTSDEAKFATKYFGYLGNDGSTPSVLNFAKMKDGEEPSAAFTRVNETTNNWGAFTFLGNFTDDQLKTVATLNSGYDHKYLFCIGYKFDSTADASTKMSKYSDCAGCFVYFGADEFGAAIPMGITGSIDFTKRDATVCFMFKQIAGEEYTISNDADYESMKGINANFYGLTQTNGKTFAFLQRGFNADGEDTGVYINEMWLKSAIATDFMNLVLSQNKIPANNTGATLIKAAISGEVDLALRNGTILPSKTLTNTDKANIIRYTGDDNAPSMVQTSGYWLDVVIEKESDEYKAYYYLVYSKGDAVRFCEGSHKLI